MNEKSTLFYIYKIVCNNDLNNLVYVGSTKHFDRRRNNHKYFCNTGSNMKLYQCIRLNGGWDNWKMIELEKQEFEDKKGALLREGYYKKLLNADLNKNVPGRTTQEYYNDCKDRLRCIKNTKFECQCGGKYTYANKAKHLKNSKKHVNFIENKSINNNIE